MSKQSLENSNDGATDSTLSATDQGRLVPKQVWRALAILCSPLFVLSALTAISFPPFASLFVVGTGLIVVCLLLIFCLEKLNARYEAEQRVER